MQYKLKIKDAAGSHTAEFVMREFDTKRSVADFMLDVLGAPAEDLVEAGMLNKAEVSDVRALQTLVFDSDDQGKFIREISVRSNGQDVDPDAILTKLFRPLEHNGDKTYECELTVDSLETVQHLAGNNGNAGDAKDAQSAQVDNLARIMFLHQIANGFAIDVTKELAELSESIAEAEKNNWIEVDVQRVAYKLTPDGKRVHDSFIAEAQELIKRYDIFGDVDIDSSGTVRFDTNLGKDLRIPVFEVENIDPFRARFLLGINDGEWDNLSNWYQLYKDTNWYHSIFSPVEQAPSVDEIGESTLRRIIEAGKAQLREDGRLNRAY